MAVTCLSGTSGALYYKPAGTTGTFGTGDVTIGTETMVVETFLNLKVGVIEGPSFSTTEDSPLFMSTIDTSFVATVLS